MSSLVVHALLIALALISFVECSTTKQYIATIHQAPDTYRLNKRDVNDFTKFLGDLQVNETLNDNGEITISLCDITKDLFGGVNTSYTVFDLDASGSVGSIASVDVNARLDVKVNVDGCLQFFFNPCCNDVGLRFLLDDPVALSATASFGAELKAFSFGVSSGTDNVNIDPLNDIHLSGFNPVIGSWSLPPILDEAAALLTSKGQFCSTLGLPGHIIGLKFCAELFNFTSATHTINVCPRVTIWVASQKILDISYAAVGGECLALSYVPQCSHDGASVAPEVMKLFQSIDVNSDYKLSDDEIAKSKALLGIYSTKSTNSESFSKMDGNSDGNVDFAEFQSYTTTQNATYNSSPNAKGSKHYSPGDVALAVCMTLIATTIVVGASLIIFAQYKGIVKIGWLGKIIPTKV